MLPRVVRLTGRYRDDNNGWLEFKKYISIPVKSINGGRSFMRPLYGTNNTSSNEKDRIY
jgi:hypothetical protein